MRGNDLAARAEKTPGVPFTTPEVIDVTYTQQAPRLLLNPPATPETIKTASELWFTAVGTGVFKAALAVTGMLASGSASLSELAADLRPDGN